MYCDLFYHDFRGCQQIKLIYIKKRTEEFKSIDKSKRINIDYAEEATEFEWRFYIEGNKFLSK